MKVAVLCNGALAIPSVQLLIDKNLLVGIGVPLTFDPFPFSMQDLAKKHQIPFALIHKSDSRAELEKLLPAVDPDVVFVMLWPSKISAELLKTPKLGFYNWHPGLLPQYRGPDPVFWEIRNREPFGAITVHQMNQHFDAGPVAYVSRIPITQTDTHSEHWDKLAEAARKATEYMISGLQTGTQLVDQDESLARYQRIPIDADRTIDWENHNADSVLALIRASLIYGGAISYFRNTPIYIVRATAGLHKDAKPGSIISTMPFTISCKSNTSVCVEEIRTDRTVDASQFCDLFAPVIGELLTNNP